MQDVYFQILIEHLQEIEHHVNGGGVFQREKCTLILQIVLVKQGQGENRRASTSALHRRRRS